MTDFDLVKVKMGAKVCTRDGRKVRILCTNLKNTDRPICAAITSKSGDREYEYTIQYFADGRVCKRYVPNLDDCKSDLLVETRNEDLMLASDNVGYVHRKNKKKNIFRK